MELSSRLSCWVRTENAPGVLLLLPGAWSVRGFCEELANGL